MHTALPVFLKQKVILRPPTVSLGEKTPQATFCACENNCEISAATDYCTSQSQVMMTVLGRTPPQDRTTRHTPYASYSIATADPHQQIPAGCFVSERAQSTYHAPAPQQPRVLSGRLSASSVQRTSTLPVMRFLPLHCTIDIEQDAESITPAAAVDAVSSASSTNDLCSVFMQKIGVSRSGRKMHKNFRIYSMSNTFGVSR